MFATLFIYFYAATIIYTIYTTINRQNKKTHIVKVYQKKCALLTQKGFTPDEIQQFTKLYYQIYNKELHY